MLHNSELKNYILIFLIGVSSFCNAQSFEFKELNSLKLKKEMDSQEEYVDPIFYYFKVFYGLEGSKTEIIKDEYDSSYICSYSQKIKSNIYLHVNECGEGGNTTLITLPRLNRSNLIDWIENIYSSMGSDISNIWNENFTEYIPEDDGAGCYFKILENINNTQIEVYCGC